MENEIIKQPNDKLIKEVEDYKLPDDMEVIKRTPEIYNQALKAIIEYHKEQISK